MIMGIYETLMVRTSKTAIGKKRPESLYLNSSPDQGSPRTGPCNALNQNRHENRRDVTPSSPQSNAYNPLTLQTMERPG